MRASILAALLIAAFALPAGAATHPVKGVAQGTATAAKGIGHGAAQAGRGGPALSLASGRGVVVQRVGVGELRLAEVGGNAVVRAWRISSATPLGEVQLAEPIGSHLAVVVKTYDEDRDEFRVLVLDHFGLARQLSLVSAAWAETAPLARFRIAGSALYQLGSTPTGAFVDRFDLEVSR